MRLRGLDPEQNLILNFLYELRYTVMTPPDPRLSRSGIAQTLGMHVRTVTRHLEGLKKRLYSSVQSWKKEFYRITLAGVNELEKRISTTVEGEVSTSKIGIKGVRKKVLGERD